MDERTAMAILEALPPERLEAMQAAAQEIVEQVKNAVIELAANIVESFGSFFDYFPEYTNDKLKAIEESIDKIEDEQEQRKRWKPVKNTVPRYHCDTRKIRPYARSCC